MPAMKLTLTAAERERLLESGADLLERKKFFEAHEAFEDLWNATASQAERDIWQGLAQVAAALVKHERGEPASAITLLAKAKKRLTGSGLLKDATPLLAGWLDALATPVTCERDLGDTGLEKALLDRLRRLLRERAGGPALS